MCKISRREERFILLSWGCPHKDKGGKKPRPQLLRGGEARAEKTQTLFSVALENAWKYIQNNSTLALLYSKSNLYLNFRKHLMLKNREINSSRGKAAPQKWDQSFSPPGDPPAPGGCPQPGCNLRR